MSIFRRLLLFSFQNSGTRLRSSYWRRVSPSRTHHNRHFNNSWCWLWCDESCRDMSRLRRKCVSQTDRVGKPNQPVTTAAPRSSQITAWRNYVAPWLLDWQASGGRTSNHDLLSLRSRQWRPNRVVAGLDVIFQHTFYTLQKNLLEFCCVTFCPFVLYSTAWCIKIIFLYTNQSMITTNNTKISFRSGVTPWRVSPGAISLPTPL